MATRLLIIGEQLPTPPDADVFASDGFVRDARNLMKVPSDKLAAIELGIDHAVFLDPEALESLIGEHIEAEELRRSLQVLFVNLGRMRRSGPPDAAEFDSLLEEALTEALEKHFAEAELAEVVERVKRIAAARPSLDRQHKAESLVGTTAPKLQNLHLITDLRPVFNEGRDAVEGMVPVATLCMTIDDRDGVPQVIRVNLSHSDLDDLCSKVELAQRKLLALRGLMESKQIPVPTV